MSDVEMRTATSEHAWLTQHLERYRESIIQSDLAPRLMQLTGWFRNTQARGRKVIVAGNGGSAAIASHCAVDFTKTAGIRCINFNEADLITCFANDYGYDRWLQKALEHYADPGDLVILISSSGKSPNMLNAARYAVQNELPLATFTGFAQDNPLRALGRLNFWVDSGVYNIVEMTHHIWLLAICDLLAAKLETSEELKVRVGSVSSRGSLV